MNVQAEIVRYETGIARALSWVAEQEAAAADPALPPDAPDYAGAVVKGRAKIAEMEEVLAGLRAQLATVPSVPHPVELRFTGCGKGKDNIVIAVGRVDPGMWCAHSDAHAGENGYWSPKLGYGKRHPTERQAWSEAIGEVAQFLRDRREPSAFVQDAKEWLIEVATERGIDIEAELERRRAELVAILDMYKDRASPPVPIGEEPLAPESQVLLKLRPPEGTAHLLPDAPGHTIPAAGVVLPTAARPERVDERKGSVASASTRKRSEPPAPLNDTDRAMAIVMRAVQGSIPPGAPLPIRRIIAAELVRGEHGEGAKAEVVLFDGLTARLECRKWMPLPDAWSTSWSRMKGGDIVFEDGRWRRVAVEPEVNEAPSERDKLVQMRDEFVRMREELDWGIAQEELRTGNSDPSHFAYSTFAKAARNRATDLELSIAKIEDQITGLSASLPAAPPGPT